MPTKKSLELKEFTLQDLKSELVETQAQYQKMQFDHATKGLENPLSMREVRRDIARMSTELRSREVAEMDQVAVANRSKIRARRAKRK